MPSGDETWHAVVNTDEEGVLVCIGFVVSYIGWSVGVLSLGGVRVRGL